jgi:putative FmdB family regulatory protein
MLYSYRCENCALDYDVAQKIDEPHELICPECEGQCRRVFTMPAVKKNEGFFSHSLGRWVDSHTDFEEGLNKVRYENDMAKWVGDNRNPKDEWVENKNAALEARKARVKQDLELEEEWTHGKAKG